MTSPDAVPPPQPTAAAAAAAAVRPRRWRRVPPRPQAAVRSSSSPAAASCPAAAAAAQVRGAYGGRPPRGRVPGIHGRAPAVLAASRQRRRVDRSSSTSAYVHTPATASKAAGTPGVLRPEEV